MIPGFLAWDAGDKKYRLQFARALELVRTGDEDADVRENTARFTRRDRRLRSRASGPVALGSQALEDSSAGRADDLSVLALRTRD